jgi:hypothetical protein
MPAFSSSPVTPPPVLIAGQPGYSFGSFDRHQPTTRMLVTSVAITSNVATVAVTIVEGPTPTTSQLITIQGTQTTTSGGAPNFNVTNAAITGVSGFTTGNNDTGTVTFALTSNNIATTVDAGEAYAPVAEIGDTMTSSGAGATGRAFGMFSMSGLASNSRDVGWSVDTPSAPSTFTAVLQASMTNNDADFVTIDTTTAIGDRTVLGVRAIYLRGKVTAVSGGSSPTIVLKILV